MTLADHVNVEVIVGPFIHIVIAGEQDSIMYKLVARRIAHLLGAKCSGFTVEIGDESARIEPYEEEIDDKYPLATQYDEKITVLLRTMAMPKPIQWTIKTLGDGTGPVTFDVEGTVKP